MVGNSFFRESSIDNIFTESALFTLFNTHFKNYQYMASYLDDFVRLTVVHEKLIYLNGFLKTAGNIMVRRMHEELLSHAPVLDVNMAALTRIVGISRHLSISYICNSCDSLILKYLENPHDTSWALSMRLNYDESMAILRLEVEDTGKGISEIAASHIFYDLFSTKKDFSEAYPRVLNGKQGMDMYHCHDLIRSINGNIGYTNKGLNKGALFWHEIPVK